MLPGSWRRLSRFKLQFEALVIEETMETVALILETSMTMEVAVPIPTEAMDIEQEPEKEPEPALLTIL